MKAAFSGDARVARIASTLLCVLRRRAALGSLGALLLAAAVVVSSSAEETPPPALEQPTEDLAEPALPDPCPDGKDVLAAQTPADQALQGRVQNALDTARLERLTKIEVVAAGKIVCLRGTAANTTDRKRAESIAGEVEGVGRVVNKLVIPLAGSLRLERLRPRDVK